MKDLQLTNFGTEIAFKEAIGLSKCFLAYSFYLSGEPISEIGFNKQTGYVYIALESGIQIASCLGQEVLYIVTDFENGEEYFYEEVGDAIVKLQELEAM